MVVLLFIIEVVGYLVLCHFDSLMVVFFRYFTLCYLILVIVQVIT